MEFLVILIIIIFVATLFYYHKKRAKEIYEENIRLIESVTNLNRGTASEKRLILQLLKHGVSPQAIFHDLYIKKSDNKFSQVDLVIATKVGIIVIEVKDYSGWIYGNGGHSQWTQVLAYGRQKYRFYNPVKQNNKHIAELKKQLKQFKNIPFYSIIVFYGDCELQEISFIPKGTYITQWYHVAGVIDVILNENEPANYTNKREIIQILKKTVENGNNVETETIHSENIRDMLGKERVFK